MVTITGSPADSDLLTSPQPTLICSIHIPQVVESLGLAVSVQWSKNGSALTSSSLVTVESSAVRVGPMLYQSTVVFSSLDGVRDNGVYTCTGIVNSTESATAAFTVAIHSKLYKEAQISVLTMIPSSNILSV